VPSAVVKNELGHTPTRADCLHFIFAFAMVEIHLQQLYLMLRSFSTGTALISLPFAVDNLGEEEILCAVELNIWADGKLSAAEQSA